MKKGFEWRSYFGPWISPRFGGLCIHLSEKAVSATIEVPA